LFGTVMDMVGLGGKLSPRDAGARPLLSLEAKAFKMNIAAIIFMQAVETWPRVYPPRLKRTSTNALFVRL